MIACQVRVILQRLWQEYEKRYEWFVQEVEVSSSKLNVTLTDEDRFHLTGYVNSHNTRLWLRTNTHSCPPNCLHFIGNGM
jgi:hypothetical protein